MTYSEWQTSRLRKRLDSCKAHKRRTWEQIATDMLYSEAMPESFVMEEDSRSLSESLRRFSGRTQEPKTSRLDAIRIFLEAEGYLTQEDMVEHAFPYHLAHSFRDAFSGNGNGSPDGSIATDIEGEYLYSSDESASLFEVFLEIRTTADMLMIVEETQALYTRVDGVSLYAMSPRRKARHRKFVRRCRGFGARSAQGKLIFFLIGKDYVDINHFLIAVAYECSDEQQHNQIIDRILCWDYDQVPIFEDFNEREPDYINMRYAKRVVDLRTSASFKEGLREFRRLKEDNGYP